MSNNNKFHKAQIFAWWASGFGAICFGVWTVFVYFDQLDESVSPPFPIKDSPKAELVKFIEGEEIIEIEISDWIVVPPSADRGEALDYIHQIQFGRDDIPTRKPNVNFGIEFPIGNEKQNEYPYYYKTEPIGLTSEGFKIKLIIASYTKSREIAKIKWKATWD